MTTTNKQRTEVPLDTVSEINRDIITLWKEQFGSAHPPPKWPMIAPEPVQNELTVVGCNPALPTSAYYNVPTFNPALVTDQQVQELAALEFRARKTYRTFYGPSKRLADEIGLLMEHVDLFFYRETDQKNLLKLVINGDDSLNAFGQRQVDLAVRLITLSKPKIILVANAFAARLFKSHFDLTALDDEGVYWVNLAGQETPVFLSGMLSGGHLDNHARERLVWHMKRTLQRIAIHNCACGIT